MEIGCEVYCLLPCVHHTLTTEAARSFESSVNTFQKAVIYMVTTTRTSNPVSEYVSEDMNWIELVTDRVQWLTSVKPVN
jgi:hypothetical protein